MRRHVDVDEWTAETLGMVARDRSSVASRLAEIADLQVPTRPETEQFLYDTLTYALSQIPPVPAAWSWGEFHNAGLQPLYDMTAEDDWARWGACAADLGLEGDASHAELSRTLIAATERLLAQVRRRLEAAGVSTHGHSGFPPPA